eukprot:TRINITY_DN6446_c0_g1_i3.p2 TRINITY_DN6446_c0_g1~~TRINITY_DN6446_c0_g1_i3.p2  ORF type:complete len:142 (-),score=46.24 TRINITY_DN6446_c0_g1_i3:177-602(-)
MADSHHKMSKKIAQLTKVIFHLHTRNEENEELMKALRKAYEREIDGIVRDANAIVLKQKEALQAQKDAGDITAKLKEQQERHESDKKAAYQEIERYKQAISDKESRAISEKEDQLKRLKDEVEGLKTRYEDKIKNLSLIHI